MIRHVERLTESKFLPQWVVDEHEARYAFCRAYVGGKTVLDCGSGEGKGSRAIAEGAPRRLVAVDRALDAVSQARVGGIVAMTAEAERLAVRGASVDVVIALEVIEHMERPEAFVAEAARVLRDDGIMICSTPNRFVRNPRLPLSGRPLNPWHLREWSPEEFEDVLSAEFARVELYGQAPQAKGLTRTFDILARCVSSRPAAILRQLVKVRRLVTPTGRLYDVRPLQQTRDCEFIVAVCANPRRSARA
jgi:2-polyprenyl-3-methyl-5-hydroxy-6-metoxy-1,4-benzoquinol methylase